MNYKGYTIETYGAGAYFVSLGEQGKMFCCNLDEAKTFIDYLVKKVCYT